MRHCLIALALLCAAPAGAAPAEPAPLWIDVRTTEEFAAGHLPGAINLPQKEIAGQIGSVESNKDRPIRLYCGIGVRAQMAKFSLEAQGYRQVSNEGGFDHLARTLGSVQGPK